MDELQAALDHLRASPADVGEIQAIARRPEVETREVLTEGRLDAAVGLVGDNWLVRGSNSTPDGSADPERQITVMNARVAALVAGGAAAMTLAGDQIYVDFDLSIANLPPGTLLAVGEAVLRVSEPPHLGCKKFVARFGEDAMRFVNSRVGRAMRLRGMNARVVTAGAVRVGDAVRKVTATVPTDRADSRVPSGQPAVASSGT
jgi:hypothetical protein